MALERDPWSRVTYNGFAKSTAEAGTASSAPASRPRARRRRRPGLAIGGLAGLALVVVVAVAGVPTFQRLWSGVPLEAALPDVLDKAEPAAPVQAPVQAAAPVFSPPAAPPAPKPIIMAAVLPPAARPDVGPPVVAASARRAAARPPKARARIERRRPGLSAAARERALEATAAANLAATVAPDSTLSGQAATLPPAPWTPE